MPPQISQSSVRHQEVIDVDNPNQDSRASSSSNQLPQEKQSLVPKQKPALRQKLDVLRFQYNALFQQDLKNFLPDAKKFVANPILISQKNQDQILLSRDFDPFSRPQIRESLLTTLRQAQQIEDLDVRLQSCSHFSEIQNDMFKSRGTLDFAQISSSVSFIEKSTLNTDVFYGLLVNDQQRLSEFAEHTIYSLVVQKQEDIEYPCLFQLTLDNQQVDYTFGTKLSEVKDLDAKFVYQDFRDKTGSFAVQRNKLLSLDQIRKISNVVKQETTFGLMLYYGGTQIEAKNKTFQEYGYRTHLLQHIIVGLKTLQQKGSMDQIIVCSDLKQPNPPELILLEQLYEEMIKTENQSDFLYGQLLPPHVLDLEDKFAKYIKNINESIAIYRQEYLKQAIEQLSAPEQALKNVKIECLKAWGLLQDEKGKVSSRNTEDEFLNKQLPEQRMGNKSVWNPKHTQRPHDKNRNPEPNIPMASEDEMARLVRAQDKASEELLSVINKPKYQNKAKIEEQRKQRHQEEQRIQKELEEQKRKQDIERLMEKIKGGDKKAAAKKKLKEPKPEDNKKDAEKFDYHQNRGENNREENKQRKEEYQKQSIISIRKDTVNERKPELLTKRPAEHISKEYQYDKYERGQKRIREQEGNEKKNLLDSNEIESKEFIQDRNRKIQEQIEANKRKQDNDKEEFQTLFSIISGQLEYDNVAQIATKYRKPNMKLFQNIQALSPRNRRSSSPRKSISPENSPRTKIQNLIGKQQQSQNSEMEKQMRMSTTKINFNKEAISDSPEQNQPSSLFKRIFCMSPKNSKQNLRPQKQEQIQSSQNQDLLRDTSNSMLRVRFDSVDQYSTFAKQDRSPRKLKLRINPTELMIQEETKQPNVDSNQKLQQQKIEINQKDQNDHEMANDYAEANTQKEHIQIQDQFQEDNQVVESIVIEIGKNDINIDSTIAKIQSETKLEKIGSLKLETKITKIKKIKPQPIQDLENKKQQSQKSPHRQIRSQSYQIDENQLIKTDQPIANQELQDEITEPLLVSQTQKLMLKQKQPGTFKLKKETKNSSILMSEMSESTEYNTINNVKNHKYSNRSSKLSLLTNKMQSYPQKQIQDGKLLLAQLGYYESQNETRNKTAFENKRIAMSQSVQPSAKLERLKIQKIIEQQKQQKNLSALKLNSKLENNLFHKVETQDAYSTRGRCKSVLKPMATPYMSIKQLPNIASRNNNSITVQQISNDPQQQDLLDDNQLQSALDKYLQDRNISPLSKQKINQTFDLSSSGTTPSSIDDSNFKIQLKQYLLEQSSSQDQKIPVSLMNEIMRITIFKKMNKQNIKLLISHAFSLVNFKKGKILYKEEDESKSIYIVISGCLSFWNRKNGQIGKVISGFTAGEECLLDKNYVCRLENCHADEESCIFQIDKDQWVSFKKSVDPKESLLLKDIALLESAFNRNFIIKKGWKNGGFTKLIQGKKIQDFLNNTYEL
ncbi:UNKNOWN [Stylonychia lemnae]|uniref:Cyclic nucleotide-binding domain-containing protein n=1 Tax=Stylonychia lemnae TaxID=5949 RepID=A0A077ZSW3_STYLE|nr:UNKNOWN [Stylonychia lemnae]|eukprot:CDW71561.1 UNKNOWN [Stylonychia lemnae]